jgi:hypothetical protein
LLSERSQPFKFRLSSGSKKKFRASGYLNMNLTTRTNSDMICARKGLAGDWTILVIVMMHYQ